MGIRVPAGSSFCGLSENFCGPQREGMHLLLVRFFGISSQKPFLSFPRSQCSPAPLTQTRWRLCLAAKGMNSPARPGWSQTWENTRALPPLPAGLWGGWKLLQARASTSRIPRSREVARRSGAALTHGAWHAQRVQRWAQSNLLRDIRHILKERSLPQREQTRTARPRRCPDQSSALWYPPYPEIPSSQTSQGEEGGSELAV